MTWPNLTETNIYFDGEVSHGEKSGHVEKGYKFSWFMYATVGLQRTESNIFEVLVTLYFTLFFCHIILPHRIYCFSLIIILFFYRIIFYHITNYHLITMYFVPNNSFTILYIYIYSADISYKCETRLNVYLICLYLKCIY